MLFFLSLLLLVQGTPLLPAETGTVDGELKNADGKPVARVRVAAMARPESLSDIAQVSVFGGLTETDELGRFRLESLRPGLYYIVAGRVDLPTYYPGTTDIRDGELVAVSQGKIVSGINFQMNETSVKTGNDFSRRSVSSRPPIPPEPVIPILLKSEDVEGTPIAAPSDFSILRFENVSDKSSNVECPLDSNSVVLNRAAKSNEYHVSVDNLPQGWKVKSMTYDGSDLLAANLKIIIPPSLPSLRPTTVTMQPITITLIGTNIAPRTEFELIVNANPTSRPTRGCK
jgi:hypothetical protein